VEIVEQIFFVLAAVAAIGFLVSGLDDLFFDSQFLVYLWKRRQQPPLALKELKLAPEQWIALLVPAWLEGGVVNKMAEYATRVVLYERYDIFIGVYPNDPETNRCVDEICATHPRIHKVTVPHPGPTSKADCLNWIYRAMRLNEVPGTREYAVVAVHDAEDVMHPLMLKVYNYFVPRTYDMAQLPVFGLELPPWKNWVGNTYIDDFAELHTKDLFIRQSIGGVVPSAGVGTAFSRQTLDKLAAANNAEPFFVGNVTEDYEIGIRIKRAGLRTGLVSVPIDRIVRHRKKDGSLGPPQAISEIVAVREIFPRTFRAAVRQRSRWILGISFQTWQQAGWAGSLPMRYTLARDRRAPLTHLINMIGYLVLAFALFQWLFRSTPWGANLYFRPVFTSDHWLWKVVIVDTWLLGYRVVQKFISVTTIYNWRQALASIPRVIVGNLVNFTATVSATWTYLGHRLFGKPIVWLKTAHTFPAEADLAEYTKSIEDLLVEDGFVTREQIFDAVRLAGGASVPFALLRMGLLSEEDFTSVWAKHSGLDVRFINPYQIPDSLLSGFLERQSVELRAVPVGQENGRITLAFHEPPSAEQLEALQPRFGGAVLPVLARGSNLAFARNRAYPRLVLGGSAVVNLPEKFHRSGSLDAVVFLDALSSQQAGRHSLADVVVDMALLSEGEARRAWAEVLGCPPSTQAQLTIDREPYYRAGPFFWWLHRLLPVQNNKIAIASRCHPGMVAWLAERMGQPPAFVAELPRKLEVAAKHSGMDLDPEQLLINSLGDKGLLKSEDLAQIKTARGLITDPLSNWLLLRKAVTEEQLNETFLEVCYLPRAAGWEAAEVRRLAPVLPPGFPEETGCYCLEECGGNVRLGLARIPAAESVRQVYDRLAGCSLFFQSLSHEQARELRAVVSGE
jgi:bacteriophage N4 adsorption protein B